MTILYFFWRENVSRITNLAIARENGVFDNNINRTMNYLNEEYLAADNMKTVEFDSGRPTLFRAGSARDPVRAQALHFQGQAKGYMPLYYRGEHFRGKTVSDLKGFAYRVRRGLKGWGRSV